jgi:hypothetical protein
MARYTCSKAELGDQWEYGVSFVQGQHTIQTLPYAPSVGAMLHALLLQSLCLVLCMHIISAAAAEAAERHLQLLQSLCNMYSAATYSACSFHSASLATYLLDNTMSLLHCLGKSVMPGADCAHSVKMQQQRLGIIFHHDVFSAVYIQLLHCLHRSKSPAATLAPRTACTISSPAVRVFTCLVC